MSRKSSKGNACGPTSQDPWNVVSVEECSNESTSRTISEGQSATALRVDVELLVFEGYEVDGSDWDEALVGSGRCHAHHNQYRQIRVASKTQRVAICTYVV